MCGISAVVDARSPARSIDAAALRAALDASLDKIAHRGPDARGQWLSDDARIALGHVRLAVNDLTPDGVQPLHSADGAVHAVVNGELYDDGDALRAELAALGHEFHTRSDSELVVALYERHGLSFASRLRGEFAVCLYDSRRRLFVAARDRYGIKPLFWTCVDGKVLVAAEAKAFLPLGWRPRWDVQSLMDLGWATDDRTLFAGVKKVRPGHVMTINASGDMQSSPYWDIEYKDKHQVETRSVDDIVSDIRSKLFEAVRIRLRADVPVGVYLSGGLDSSAIAGIIKELKDQGHGRLGSEDSSNPVSCFGIAFDEDSGYDESARTAAHLGFDFHKKHMNEAELASRFEDATYHSEIHNPDLNFVGKFALSELPRELGFKVVLTGEGSDEIFSGYAMFLPDFFREPDHAWPTDLDDGERARLCEEHDRKISDSYLGTGADGFNRDECVASRQLNNITTPASLTAFCPTCWASWAREAHPHVDPRDTVADNVPGTVKAKMTECWHPLHSAQYVWTKGNLSNIFLACLGDRTEMAHSIEARTPFLDHALTRAADALPPSLKIRRDAATGRFVEKYVLREAVRPFVTDEIYKRTKFPYSAPTAWPAGGPLHRLLKGLVTRETIEALGFVEWSAVEDVVERAFGQGDVAALRTALVLGEWVVLGQRFGVEKAGPVA